MAAGKGLPELVALLLQAGADRTLGQGHPSVLLSAHAKGEGFEVNVKGRVYVGIFLYVYR